MRGTLRKLRRGLDGLAVDGRSRALPFVALLGAFLALRVWGIGWGIAGTHAWDNDGVAPRDVYPAVVYTFTPGAYYTYPPLHMTVLALLCLPVALVALARAPSLGRADVVSAFLTPGTTAAIAYIARAVTIGMSLAFSIAVFRAVRETHGRRAAALSAVATAGLTSFSFYARTSNLDVPFLAWSAIALAGFSAALVADRPDRLRRPMLAVAAAVATKDQAYALFLLALPVYFLGWLALTAPGRRRRFLREALLAIGLGVGALALFDGALFNPTGFLARVRFLLGPASQDYAEYGRDLAGRLSVLRALLRVADDHVALLPLALIPIGLLAAREVRAHGRTPPAGDASQRRRRLAAALPALFALSFVVAFNFQARRTEHRFAMPVWLYLTVYAGIGADAILRRLPSRAAPPLAYAALAAVTLFRILEVDVNLAADPRYAVERFLRALPAGTTVETYGGVVYLPHFPETLRVSRVGVDPPEKRSPLVGAAELPTPFLAVTTRRPEYVVLNATWAAPFLVDPKVFRDDGRVPPTVFAKSARDDDGVRLFRGLFAGTLGYRVVLPPAFTPWRALGVPTDGAWPFRRLAIHGTTGADVYVFARDDR